MSYRKNCDLQLKEETTEVERYNKRITYKVIYCENCGREYHRTTIREEDINESYPSTDNPRPKDPR